jgi:hypothetical protein
VGTAVQVVRRRLAQQLLALQLPKLLLPHVQHPQDPARDLANTSVSQLTFLHGRCSHGSLMTSSRKPMLLHIAATAGIAGARGASRRRLANTMAPSCLPQLTLRSVI